MPIRQTTPFLAVSGVVLAAGFARAQEPGEVIIEIDRPVLMPGEAATVRMLAGFDSTRDFAMGGLITDLLADAGGVGVSSAWSDVRLVGLFDNPLGTTGTPVLSGFEGVIAGQLHDPFSPWFTDTSDPITFWEATFTAPTDQGAFTVDLSTRTLRFDVYIAIDSSRSESRLDGLTEGSGRITVVPAPAGGLVFFGLLATCRRR